MELSERLIKKLEAEGYTHVYEGDDEPNVHDPAHTHEYDVCLCVAEGSLSGVVGEEEHTLGPDDCVVIPKGVLHQAKVGPEGARYVIGEKSQAD